MRDGEMARRAFLGRVTALTAAASAGAAMAFVPREAAGATEIRTRRGTVRLPDPEQIVYDDPADLTVAEAASLIRGGSLDPRELLEAHLARIEAFDGLLQAFNTVTADEARRRAERLARAPWRGPLHGIPVALKDNYYTAGVPTTANSHIYADFVPDFDATAWARMADAGAILLGKTQMGPLATTSATTPDGERTTVNAWAPTDRRVSPGGSSSGSATAVAARMATVSTGTQTGGSITNPSNAQGLTGLKPTMGRVSLYGIIPLTYTRDHPGPLARDAMDTAILLQTMAGPDPSDPRTQGLPAVPDYVTAATPVIRNGRPALRRPTTVGVPPGYTDHPEPRELPEGIQEEESPERVQQMRERLARREERNEAEVRARRAMLDTFRELGAEVVDVELPAEWETLTSWNFNNVRLPERTEPFLEHLREDVRLFGVSLSPWINGLLMPGVEYLRGQRAKLLLLRRVLDGLLARCDVVLQTTPIPFDMIGLPLVAFPNGTADGRPTGALLGGQPYREDRLLEVVAAYQAATDWHRGRPDDPVLEGGTDEEPGVGREPADPGRRVPSPPAPGPRMGVWEVMESGE